MNTHPKGKSSCVPISLSFDDGLQFQYDAFFPILAEHDVRSTFYVITSQVNKLRFMTEDALTDISKTGNEIGSHTHTHPHLTQLSDEQLDFELATSKEKLAHFGCSTLAYPYGEYDDRVIQAARRYYAAARSYHEQTTLGPNYGYNTGVPDDLHKLKTFPTERALSPLEPPLIKLSMPRFQRHIKELVREAVEKKAWTILVFHAPVNSHLWRLRSARLNRLMSYKIRHKFRWLCEFLSTNEQIETLPISESLHFLHDQSKPQPN